MFCMGAAEVRPGILLSPSMPVRFRLVAYSTMLSQGSPPIALIVVMSPSFEDSIPLSRLIIMTPLKPSSWPMVLAPPPSTNVGRL